MGVGRPCPHVRNHIVIPRHLCLPVFMLPVPDESRNSILHSQWMIYNRYKNSVLDAALEKLLSQQTEIKKLQIVFHNKGFSWYSFVLQEWFIWEILECWISTPVLLILWYSTADTYWNKKNNQFQMFLLHLSSIACDMSKKRTAKGCLNTSQ